MLAFFRFLAGTLLLIAMIAAVYDGTRSLAVDAFRAADVKQRKQTFEGRTMGQVSGKWKPELLAGKAYFNANVSYNSAKFQDDVLNYRASTTAAGSRSSSASPSSRKSGLRAAPAWPRRSPGRCTS